MRYRNKKKAPPLPKPDVVVSPSLDAIAGTRQAMEAARYLRIVVTVSTTLLTMGFGWLKFRGVDVLGILSSIPSTFILKLAMAIYFASWIAGLLSDLADMEFVFVKAPQSIHVKIGGTVLGLLTAISFGALCFVETMRAFSVALLILLVVNLCGWCYLTRVATRSAEAASRSFYLSKGKLLALEQLNLVYCNYQRGTWQLFRFAYGFLCAGIIAIFAFKYNVLEATFTIVTQYGEIISAALFLIYVLSFEGWIWFMRMRVKGGLCLLVEFEEKYELRRRVS